ncbi:MAG: hypothetical protein NVS1B4_16950 [Gemmatimonadaceae bacterium]
MKLVTTLSLCSLVVAVGACKSDKSVAPAGPTALIRFVNAVPDTGTVDFRFVDRLENLPTTLGVAFRKSSGLYQRVGAGTRPVRVFANDTTIAGASTRLVDASITLNAGSRYTLVYVGSARARTARLVVLQDNPPANPATGNIALNVLNAIEPLPAAVDVYVAGSGQGDPVVAAGATVISNVAYATQSAYSTLPALTAPSANTLYRFAVTASGTTVPTIASALPDEPGVPASGSTSRQAGVRQSGSILTAIVVPGAVAGSRAAAPGNGTPSVVLLLNNVPSP